MKKLYSEGYCSNRIFFLACQLKVCYKIMKTHPRFTGLAVTCSIPYTLNQRGIPETSMSRILSCCWVRYGLKPLKLSPWKFPLHKPHLGKRSLIKHFDPKESRKLSAQCLRLISIWRKEYRPQNLMATKHLSNGCSEPSEMCSWFPRREALLVFMRWSKSAKTAGEERSTGK